jgi:hypothetical protein
VVLTTGGGLYRYALGDLIRVTGTYRNLPILEFLGRDQISDMVGEKLHESEVDRTVNSVLKEDGITVQFRMVAPEKSGYQFGYVLFIQPASESAEGLIELAPRIDKLLQANYHYRYARAVGQLLPFQITTVSGNPSQRYLDRLMSEGIKAGNIKPVCLDRRCGWSSWFNGNHSQVDVDQTILQNHARKGEMIV